MEKNIISRVNIILLLCISILLSGFLDNVIPSNLRLLIILIIIIIIIIKPLSLLKKWRGLYRTWENIDIGMSFKLIKIIDNFDDSIKPNKKTGVLEIEIKGKKKETIFPIHFSCWEGRIPVEGFRYIKSSENYFIQKQKM
jgi:hypothetical protein